jgi:hypothetical protein
MAHWTILWITFLGGPFDGNQTGLLYRSEAECWAAHQTISDTLRYDHKVACEVTNTLSASPRPKRRP